MNAKTTQKTYMTKDRYRKSYIYKMQSVCVCYLFLMHCHVFQHFSTKFGIRYSYTPGMVIGVGVTPNLADAIQGSGVSGTTLMNPADFGEWGVGLRTAGRTTS